MSTPQEIRVGLVGAGYVSAYHIRALQTLPHVRIVGIVDTSVDRAHALAERFGIPCVFASLSDMRQSRPDVVHVLTPPASHARLAIEALEMGCHVFVEKPMAPTAAECDEMIAAANRAGRALSVNHSAKDDPVVVRALELLRRGACGDVLGVDFHRTSDYPAVWRRRAARRLPVRRVSVPGHGHPCALPDGGVSRTNLRYRCALPVDEQGPERVFRRMARRRRMRTRDRRVLSLLVGATDPQRAVRPRDARRHAHRLFSSDLHGAQVAARPEAYRRQHQRDDARGRHALARAEERVASCHVERCGLRRGFMPACCGSTMRSLGESSRR